jgi:hypothetical protein
VKWTYRECDVTITTAFGSPGLFRPVVEIDCSSPGPPTALTTGKTFVTTEEAVEFGKEMARDWIDGHSK